MAIRGTRKPTPVGGALRTAFARLGLSGRLAQQRALVLWPEVVGPQIAAATRPVWVRDGILCVATRSSTWSHELIYQKATILDRLRRKLGEGVLSDIRFVAWGYREPEVEEPTGPPWPSAAEWEQMELDSGDREAIARILEPIQDPDLRGRLERVLVHDRRAQHWKETHGWHKCARCGVAHAEPGEVCGVCRSRRTRR